MEPDGCLGGATFKDYAGRDGVQILRVQIFRRLARGCDGRFEGEMGCWGAVDDRLRIGPGDGVAGDVLDGSRGDGVS